MVNITTIISEELARLGNPNSLDKTQTEILVAKVKDSLPPSSQGVHKPEHVLKVLMGDLDYSSKDDGYIKK